MKVKPRITDKILDIIEGYPDNGSPLSSILDGTFFGWLHFPLLHIVDFFSSAVSYLRREKEEYEE